MCGPAVGPETRTSSSKPCQVLYFLTHPVYDHICLSSTGAAYLNSNSATIGSSEPLSVWCLRLSTGLKSVYMCRCTETGAFFLLVAALEGLN